MRIFTSSMVITVQPGLLKGGQDACQTKWRLAGRKRGKHFGDFLTFFMAKTELTATLKPDFNFSGRFQCFGFGYNGFAQFATNKNVNEGRQVPPVDSPGSSVLTPLLLNVGFVSSIVAPWSNTLYLRGRVCSQ